MESVPFDSLPDQRQLLEDFQRQIEATLAPVFALQERMKKAVEDAFGMPRDELLEYLGQIQTQQDTLQRFGILHASTPFHLLVDTVTDEELRQSIQSFYEKDWKAISESINQRIASCDVDEEAKATFDEGLKAFEQGLYRSVCRTLLPEIERVVRIELRAGEPGKIFVSSFMESAGGKLTLHELVPSGLHGLALFKCLVDHVYKEVKDTVVQAKMKADPVPNRHAAIHGLVSYNSFWNALNTIFMADFAFQMVSRIKASQSVAPA